MDKKITDDRLRQMAAFNNEGVWLSDIAAIATELLAARRRLVTLERVREAAKQAVSDLSPFCRAAKHFATVREFYAALDEAEASRD